MAAKYEYSDGSSTEEETRDDPTTELARLKRELDRQCQLRLTAEVRVLELEEEQQTLHKGSPNPKDIVPKEYDGTTDIRAYLKHFEACRKLNGWTRSQAKEWLEARLMWDATKILDTPRETYADLKEALLAKYGPEKDGDTYSMELRTRRRKPGESLRDLAHSIKELATLTYPELSEEALDHVAREQFKEGVDDTELRQAIFLAKPQSLEEAVKAAVGTELFQKGEKARNKRSSVREIQVLQANVEKLTNLVAQMKMDKPQPSGEYQQPPKASISQAPPQPLRSAPWHMQPGPVFPAPQPSGEQYPMPTPMYPPTRGQYSVPTQRYMPPIAGPPMSPPPRPFYSGPQQRPQNVCWMCGEPGHFRRNCPLNYSRPTPWPQGRPQGQPRGQ